MLKMRWMVGGAAVAVLAACVAMRGSHAEDAAMTKAQKVRKLMELTGEANLGKNVIQQVSAQMQANEQQGGLPQGFTAKFSEMAKPDEMLELAAEIRGRLLDEADIDAAIVFWSSPAGQRLLKAQAGIGQETGQAINKWVNDLAGQVRAAVAGPGN